MNYSKQRETMLSLLQTMKSHPTANEIYLEMRKTEPKISLGTVYRNLNLLSKNGSIARIDSHHDSVRFDGDTSRHYHFVCNLCGKVVDLMMDQIDLADEVKEACGGEVNDHSLIFYGLCKDCKLK